MTYKFDSIVNRKEVEDLKNMIFNRVRERSENLSTDTFDDVMTSARKSFVSNNNPFSQIVNQEPKTSEKTLKQDVIHANTSAQSVEEASPVLLPKEKDSHLGFPIKQIATNLSTQSHLINEQYAMASIESTMREAKEGLSKRKSFMDTLNSLNAMGAVSLIRTRSDKFEAIF